MLKASANNLTLSWHTKDFDCRPNNNLINMLIDPNLIANVILICRLFDIKGLGGFH